MDWYPEKGDIPISKPKELLDLERCDRATRQAMTTEEIHIHVEQVASGMAKKVEEELHGDYEECVLVVSTALHLVGQAIGDRLGNHMMDHHLSAAQRACRLRFPEPSELRFSSSQKEPSPQPEENQESSRHEEKPFP